MYRIKRVYERAEGSDGMRVLVDRLWPRGLSREKLKLDAWLKDVAPSPELRKWFSHKPERFEEFKRCYIEELKSAGRQLELEQIRRWAETNAVTLLYAAKDEHCNHAVILQQFLEKGSY